MRLWSESANRHGGGQWFRSALALTGAFAGWQLLGLVFRLFHAAYLRVAPTVGFGYWQALRFAFEATVLTAAIGGALLCLGLMELACALRR